MTDANEIDADKIDAEGLWTESQMAAFANVTKNALYRHRVAGTGPAFVLVSKAQVRYRPSVAHAWVKEREFQSMADYYASHQERARTAERQRTAAVRARKIRWTSKSPELNEAE